MSATNILLATDLDRTLIYSAAAVAEYGLGATSGQDAGVVCVECYDGRESSFMTTAAALMLTELSHVATVVPVTTRTGTQLARVRLPGPAPRYAIAANGGLIFADGVLDAAWSAQVAERLAYSAPLSEVLAYARGLCDPQWTAALRDAEGLFCYAVLDRERMPAGIADAAADWASERGWRTSLQGRKLYWVPEQLRKSSAVAEVARRVGAELVLAAGDSLLDTDLLLAADLGIHPRHGELFGTGFRVGHVRQTDGSGVLAGEQIVRWFAETVRDRPQAIVRPQSA